MAPSILRFRSGVTLPRQVYLDVNFLVDARDPLSSRYRSARECLRELILNGVEMTVSTLVFDELWWADFKRSYRLLTGNEMTAREYKANIEISKWNWPTIRRMTEEMLAWDGLNVVDVAPALEVTRDAMALIDRNPLAPRDAFHLALVLRHRIPGLVTSDSDFDRVELPDGTNLTIIKV